MSGDPNTIPFIINFMNLMLTLFKAYNYIYGQDSHIGHT